MKDKILVFIHGIPPKKTAILTLAQMGYDFIECFNLDDMKFKLELFKDSILLMIHELDHNNYQKDFEMLEEINSKGIKTLLIIDKYNVKIIDDAMASGTSDIIELPLKNEILRSKINNIVDNKEIIPEVVEKKDISWIEPEVIEKELLRADRGKYSVSLIMIELYGVNEEEMLNLSEKFSEKLRETDIVMRYGTKRLLLVCPFTDKEHTVEIENKIRDVLEENIDNLVKKASAIVYGISYPKDGEDSIMLIKMLNEGVMNSKMIGKTKGTFRDISKEEIEAYRKIFKKN